MLLGFQYPGVPLYHVPTTKQYLIPGNIMIVGGSIGGTYTADAEIIDPNNANSNCTKPPNYPTPVFLSSGGFISGHFVVCGGNNATDLDGCYMHDPSGR